MIHKLFPIFDQLYIFQNFEYEPIDFLKWFSKNLFKRNLQQKHHLHLTTKALLLLILGLVLIFLSAGTIVWWGLNLPVGHWYSDITTIILFLVIVQFFSPFYLIISWLLLYPLEEYQKLKLLTAAREKLKKLPNLKVVAITGSFAKTSTKDILYTLLWKDFRVVKTPKSFNTPMAIARTILEDLKDNTEVFLVEMDAYHPGEIKKLANLVNPQIGIITSIAPQHLERFGSMEKLAKTQFELAEALPKDGVLVLNSANEWIIKLANDYSVNKIFYGESDFKQINLPLFGTHHIQNFLAAAAVASNLGLSHQRIEERAQWILPTPHRLEIKKQGGLTIIDNTYNTNPLASKASLKLLTDYPGKQKIIITPGLVELGKEHSRENIEFAKNCAQAADQIIIVGENAKKDLQKGLEEVNYSKERIHLAKTIQEALRILPGIIKPTAVVLLENDLPDQYF